MDPSSEQSLEMSMEKKPRPNPEEALKCPRCDSTSTKFCYYNNYSLSQPRYFCKSCRRYWTKGGTLRNVPVGGGCRKKRSSSLSKRAQDQTSNPNPNPFPHLSYDSNDFTLALASFQKQSSGQLGNYNDHDLSILGNPTGSFCDILGNNSGMHNPSPTNHGFLDAIRTGFLETQNHLQNLYSVYGNGDMGEVDNGNSGGIGVSGIEMMLPYDQVMNNASTQSMSVTSMKQEQCNGREQSEKRVLGGFPWQLNGDINISELDSGRALSWNNFTSSWHGLLQSPLM